MPENNQQILRSPEVCRRTGLSRVTLWRLERQGAFPPRRQLSPNAVGWLAAEIDEWIGARRTVTVSPATDREIGKPVSIARDHHGRRQNDRRH